MIFTSDQFVEIAFLFEKENGNTLGEYENNVIDASTLKNIPVDQLEASIIEGLKKNAYIVEKTRISAYWALSKRFNPDLIPHFKTWLQQELDAEKNIAIFQLMIALDRLNEPVFDATRTGVSFDEFDLNVKDAVKYLT
ncbi:hypothetical protein [uncultured Kordia sp.]|uniref:hypothetical protein n=1 Tax=uncultured Kordia sp. TaxID=507699 RepID=UPI002606A3C6|nr:hypothetical protein [uncultured Kordia sp.]